MRALPLLAAAAVIGLGLAACAMTEPPPPRAASPQAQAELARLIDGRTAGPTVSCVPGYPTDQFYTIDENRIAIRTGGGVYVNQLNGPCHNAGLTGYSLRTRRPAGSGLCRGEIVEVIDSATGTMVGSCSLGDFVTYRRAG